VEERYKLLPLRSGGKKTNSLVIGGRPRWPVR